MTDTAAAVATAASTKKRALPQDQPDQARKQRKTSPASPPPSSEPTRTTKVPAKFAGHTKKERKQNRSTRIHSLRKLLGRETLPSTIRQEKERELAALVHEQSANRSKKEGRKVLEKYHYVRFVERRKAEKKLRQLEKQLEALESGGGGGGGGGDDDQRVKLQRRIHEMEVHKNYAIYAPLNQKYISIFAQNASGSRSDTSDQDSSGIARKRPSLWYTVESAMKQGEKELELLRDGRSRLLKQESHIARDVNEKGTNGKSTARSDKDSSQKTTARQARSVQHEPGESEASDDDFFER